MQSITVHVAAQLSRLLQQEDTDGDGQITRNDRGPKRFRLESLEGQAFEIAGQHFLSNLLHELIYARDRRQEQVTLEPALLFQPPAERLHHSIRNRYWQALTRRMDREHLPVLLADSKAGDSERRLIYVPADDEVAYRYYREAAAALPELGLEVRRLPAQVTPTYVRSINDQPGILSLAFAPDDSGNLRGLPYVVPGGRFNELYGWDSYFIVLGLLQDQQVELAKSITDNFVYEIDHYGKILNANRSYYLTRTQPPFLTSMARAIYPHLPPEEESRSWLARVLRAAIAEYENVWMGNERLTATGLNRYYGEGIGMPPETEPTHYDAVLQPFARRAGIDLATYTRRYRAGEISEPELEKYFKHDRSVRESGHDTSYRLDGVCAHLNTVDLNALLYKYEIDIAELIQQEFKDRFRLADGRTTSSGEWFERAGQRKTRVDALLWNESRGLYFDYNFELERQTGFESATMFYPLWSGLASAEQAAALIRNGLGLLEAPGGIVSGSQRSRGAISAGRPQRQWDYPFGWAPHQMLLWQGLHNYGRQDVAERLIYRWLYLIARTAGEYNGVIVEKYDVIERSHEAEAEYGNVGLEFEQIPREGFGWTNASFQVGYALLDSEKRALLNRLVPPEWIFGPAPVR